MKEETALHTDGTPELWFEQVQAWIARAYRQPTDAALIDAPRFTRFNMEVAVLEGERRALERLGVSAPPEPA